MSTTDIRAFASEHHTAIERLIENAAHSDIVAEPLRYLRDTGHTFIAFREQHAHVWQGDEWFAVLDVDTGISYIEDTLLQAWRTARTDARRTEA
jgi:hypothetical protein